MLKWSCFHGNFPGFVAVFSPRFAVSPGASGIIRVLYLGFAWRNWLLACQSPQRNMQFCFALDVFRVLWNQVLYYEITLDKHWTVNIVPTKCFVLFVKIYDNHRQIGQQIYSKCINTAIRHRQYMQHISIKEQILGLVNVCAAPQVNWRQSNGLRRKTR